MNTRAKYHAKKTKHTRAGGCPKIAKMEEKLIFDKNLPKAVSATE